MIEIYIIGVIGILLTGFLGTWLLYLSDEKQQELQNEFNLDLLTFDPVPFDLIQTKKDKHWLVMPVATCIILFILVFFAAQASKRITEPILTNNITAIKKQAIWPVFTSSVQEWSDEIIEWGDSFNIDPNMIATVMQIESCGNPYAVSSANAQGLFQVMPFHFSPGDDMQDPQTNASKGMSFLFQQLTRAREVGNEYLAFAAYNGGGSIFNKHHTMWPAETQRYYNYALSIYAPNDMKKANEGVDHWLQAGGERLCQQAELIIHTQ